MQEAQVSLKTDSNTEFLAKYPLLDGIFDEMSSSNGDIRPHWEYMHRSLKMLGQAELERRGQDARRLLRDNGVSYNVCADAQNRDRPWQLDPIPLLIASQEWSGLEKGLIQRAELLSLLLTDLYGPQETLKRGLLPVELVSTHPGFLRACHGLKMSPLHPLPLYAADLVRTPDGEWRCLADRTQAPIGAGYALENRIIMSRILPSLFRDSHVHRLALFFRTLRTTLARLGGREDHRIVVLTPGPANEAYFEHAYLAKYLGYTLVEGGDLIVREGKVRLKTLDGLQSVDVILRRVNDSYCDPLELRQDSLLGVAGLVQSVRLGKVAIANPLGSNLLENPGLLPFLPKLAKYFLDEELLMPSPQTWWCGDPQSRNYVLANLEQLIIKRIASVPGKMSIRGQMLSSKQRELLADQIRTQPNWFVGSEEIARSTAPVFVNGRLEPRYLVLRSFLVSSEHGYRVMPGGLTRVALNDNNPIISTNTGGLSKDTWVLASEPTNSVSLIPTTQSAYFEGTREMPSRVAENLFWLGRYAERAESTIRLLRTVLIYLTEPFDYPSSSSKISLHSLLRAVTSVTETYPGFVGEGAAARLEAPEIELLSIFLDSHRPGSLSFNLQFLLNSARSVRDRVSPDIWRVLSNIEDQLQALQKETPSKLNDTLVELDNLITALAAFAGLSLENMTQGQGWRFLMIGRRLERAFNLTQLLRTTLSTPGTDDSALLEHLLNTTDSLLTYRRHFRSQPEVQATLQLILHSEENPRALGYQLANLEKCIGNLPRNNSLFRSQEERLSLEALTLLRLADIKTLAQPSKDNFRTELDQLLARLGHLLPALSDALTSAYFSHAEQPQHLM